MTMPMHYLTQFHPNYTAVADIEAKMKEEGFMGGSLQLQTIR